MLLTVNGDSRPAPDGVTVSELLSELGVQGTVAVERNGAIVPRADHPQTALQDGDALEIVQFVGGG